MFQGFLTIKIGLIVLIENVKVTKGARLQLGDCSPTFVVCETGAVRFESCPTGGDFLDIVPGGLQIKMSEFDAKLDNTYRYILRKPHKFKAKSLWMMNVVRPPINRLALTPPPTS